VRTRTHRIAIAAGAILMSMAGCAVTTGQPSATPADILGIAADLGEQGLSASDFVSGDAGCADRELTQLAVSMDVTGLDQAEPTRIHLYLFRDQAVYDRLRSAVDACVASFATDPAAFGLIEAPPYVAAGAGPWAPAFNRALRTALTKASGG
jgi:hypothetical protein